MLEQWKNIMRITSLALTLFAAVFALYSSIEAQQPKKIPRIGFLVGGLPSSVAARREAFREGLRELGHVEGKSIVIEWRYAEGKFDRLPTLAAELVSLNVDIIVTTGATITRAVKEAMSTIAIVMAQDNDPVGN